MTEIILSSEQKYAFDKYLEGKNIFITGPGGTGKSALIKKIYHHATVRNKNIRVTALTGCAALLLDCESRTLHSWAGIGLGTKSAEALAKSILNNKKKRTNWRSTQILVIDEISMMSKKLFELLFDIAQIVRNDRRAFGGIQVIFSGDFYQLPPIGNRMEEDSVKFCFESPYWSDLFKKDCVIQLVKIFRQKDSVYSEILNQIREGKIKKSSNNILNELVGRKVPEDYIIKPTKLFPVKMSVEQINNYEIEKIDSKVYEYKIKTVDMYESLTKSQREMRNLYFTKIDIEAEQEYLLNNTNFDHLLRLKKGCQVMCMINITNSDDEIIICNGSQGIIVDINDINIPLVKFNNGITTLIGPANQESDKIPGICIVQIPLILSWALTIHKSQGTTLEAAEIDAGKGIFECGQTYVALSRVKSLEGLFLSSFDVSKIKINKKVKEFYESLKVDNTYNEKEEKNEEKVFEKIEKTDNTQQVNVCDNNVNKSIFSKFEYKEDNYDS